MSLVTAIKSLITPTKYYRNANITVAKKLLPNGSTSTEAYNRDGKLLKSIVSEPIDEFIANRLDGNTLRYGHRTTVNDYVSGTVTNIEKYEKRFEKPLYNALIPRETLVDAGGSIHYFHKFKKFVSGSYIDSFNMTTNKNGWYGAKVLYNDFGMPLSAVKYKLKKG